MSYDTERYQIAKLSGQSLSVVECGLQICHSGHASKRTVYSDFSAHFIIEGKGIYKIKDKSFELSKGQGFLITPGVPNIYIADDKEPWKYIYASFRGADAKALVKNCGLGEDNVTFNFDLDDEMLHNLRCMHRAGRDYLSKGYDITGYFMIVMSNLIRNNSKKEQENLTPDKYVKLACEYIEDRFAYDISVKDIADFVKIDRTHLFRLFIKHMGISPSKYLFDVRLKRAVSLMEHDSLSINEIALSSGFYDLSHFSKAFLAKYNISPGKYRKILCEKEK